MRKWNGSMRIARAKILTVARVLYSNDPVSEDYARSVDYARLSPIIKNRYERMARAAIKASRQYDRDIARPIPADE